MTWPTVFSSGGDQGKSIVQGMRRWIQLSEAAADTFIKQGRLLVCTSVTLFC